MPILASKKLSKWPGTTQSSFTIAMAPCLHFLDECENIGITNPQIVIIVYLSMTVTTKLLLRATNLLGRTSTFFMIFNVRYNICEGPELDA